MNKEQYLPWTFVNGRPAVRGDLPKLWALAKSKKIILRMEMKNWILDYTYKFI